MSGSSVWCWASGILHLGFCCLSGLPDRLKEEDLGDTRLWGDKLHHILVVLVEGELITFPHLFSCLLLWVSGNREGGERESLLFFSSLERVLSLFD